ncbi:hypothetical protein HPB48_001723 [Haemaphysalis longicornis]|uniref:Uncharacterized protein n=1 Tax=Haemaphysalis longicornis TaxID=44386 RepID=A0A9J6GVT9_HAELO|nr:hypothetical protein HPB48_001723 [Haemaphysalis longicornis]
MNKVFEEMCAENKQLKVANSKLEEKCDALACQVKLQEARLVEGEQYSRNRNIEIKGLPDTPKECLEEVIAKISNKVGVPVVPADLESVHRVPVGNQPGNKNIVVQFPRRHLRDKFLEEVRSRRLN